MNIENIIYSVIIILIVYIFILIFANIVKYKFGTGYKLKKYIYLFVFAFGTGIFFHMNIEILNFFGRYGGFVKASINMVIAFTIVKSIDILFNDYNIFNRKSEKLPKLVRSLFIFSCMGIVILIILKVNLLKLISPNFNTSSIYSTCE